MAEDRWPIQLANIIRAARDTELALAKLQEAINGTHQRLERIRQTYAPPVWHIPGDQRQDRGNWAPFIVPGGVMDKSWDAPPRDQSPLTFHTGEPTPGEAPLKEGPPNPVVPQSLRTVLNENDSQVQGDTP